MANEITPKVKINQIKAILNADSVKQQFENALRENAGAFVASIIDLYASDTYLQNCDPNQVVMECLKAATLKLPINKQLGFAYIVPYKKGGVQIPQFQIGYKGYIQLAMRTGQYRTLNAGTILEGVKVESDMLTGEVRFTGAPTSQKPQGYFCHMELINGFKKTVYMTLAEITAHGKRYSKSFNSESSAWNSNFDEMAMKTCIRKLLGHYGVLSTEMLTALTSASDDEGDPESEIAGMGNAETIDIPLNVVGDGQPAEQGPGF